MFEFIARARHWAIPAGLALGLALIALLVTNRQMPQHDETSLPVPTVSFVEVQPVPFQLEARGHGIVRPAEIWRATANVGGRVVERHTDLESGNLLREGTLLLALDPSRYRLAIAEAEAEIVSLVADWTQNETEEKNSRRQLALERQRLVMAEKELSRIERLAKSGSVSQSRLDEQRRATVARRQAAASLENEIALIPSRRQRLKARLERAATRLAQARRDLEDTRFVAPYDLRLDEVEAEMHQYIGAGKRLFQAHSIEAVEVEAQLPLPTLRRLMSAVSAPERDDSVLDITKHLDFSEVRGEVLLVGAKGVRWPARVARVASGLDPGTRTARVVVTVDEPYRRADPPRRPALQRDMYVRVRLSADSAEPKLVVPAGAVHEGKEIYLLDDQGRLRRRPVTVAFEQGDLAVIGKGLAPGDRVIVDDPVPAVDGMHVNPQPDEALKRQLRVMALGSAS